MVQHCALNYNFRVKHIICYSKVTCSFLPTITKPFGQVCHYDFHTNFTRYSVFSLALFPLSFSDRSFSFILNVFFLCDCFWTSMPLKWSCGSTVFALNLQPLRVQIMTKLTPVLYEGFQLRLVSLPQHFSCTHSHVQDK